MRETKIKKGFFSGRKGKQRIFICAMLAFPILHFLVFWLWVNVDGLLLPFKNNVGNWIGFENFKWVFNRFLNGDANLDMWQATKNTLIFFAWGMFVELPISVILAYVFFKKLPGGTFFTICLYLPSIISATVMTTIFKNCLGADGPIAWIFNSMGKKWVNPITQDGTSIPSMLLYSLWNGYGLNIILFQSSMKRIPRELFESASLDGITLWKELIYMIVPLIWPILTTKIILSVAGIFGASGPILLFTNGKYGTRTIGFVMYEQYKVYNQIARAATIGLLYTIIGLPLVFGSRWLAGKIGGEYEY